MHICETPGQAAPPSFVGLFDQRTSKIASYLPDAIRVPAYYNLMCKYMIYAVNATVRRAVGQHVMTTEAVRCFDLLYLVFRRVLHLAAGGHAYRTDAC